MSFWTNASSPEITIVMAATTTIRLIAEPGIDKPSQNTG